MYTKFETHKIIRFSLLMGAIFVALFLTLHFQNNNSFEYDLWMNNNLDIIRRNVKAADYAFDFDRKGSNLSFASYFLNVGKSIFPSHFVSGEGTLATEAVDVPVLLYHGIVKKSDRFSITSEKFADQMLALKKDGWQTITLNDFAKFVNNEKKLPPKSFLLTFDDGRRDSFNEADPVLKALGFNAVMFVSTESSLRPTNSFTGYYLNEMQLNTMLNSGRWEIGSHAVQQTGGFIKINKSGDMGYFLSNKKLLPNNVLETNQEYKERIEHELIVSKQKLEETFEIDVGFLSYPFSDYGQQTINNPNAVDVINDIVRKTYFGAFEQSWPGNYVYLSNYIDIDHYHMRRIEVDTDWSGEVLVDFLGDVSTKNIPYKDEFSTDNGWRKSWGYSSVSTNFLSLGAIASTTGSFVFLDGTYWWKDYLYTADVNWKSGSHLSLIGRFLDNNNYVACTFSEQHVRIDETINGVTKNTYYEVNPITLPKPKATFGMLVKDNQVKCFEGSRVVAVVTVQKNAPLHGGIGLRIWDKNPNVGSVTVSSVQVLQPGDELKIKELLPTYKLK